MPDRTPHPDDLLTPGAVAELARVDRKTISRWENEGRIAATRTPGGHRRFRWADVEPLMPDTPDLLTREQVAEAFRVRPDTVSRWAQQGRIEPVVTLGGPAGTGGQTSMRSSAARSPEVAAMPESTLPLTAIHHLVMRGGRRD